MKNFKNKTIGVLLVTVLSLSFSGQAQAGWPTSNVLEIPGVGLDDALETVRAETQNMLLAKMQQESIKQIQHTMEELVTGGYNKKSMVVTNYADFIYGASNREAEMMMTDFFQKLTSNVSEGEKEMLRDVETELKNELFPKAPTLTLGKVTGSNDPLEDVFKGGTTHGYKEMIKGDYNHHFDIKQNVRNAVLNYMEMSEDVKRTMVIANQGFVPTNGVPGSVISQVVAAAESAPINMITSAASTEQIVSNLSTSMLTTFMRSGYNTLSRPSENQAAELDDNQYSVEKIQRMIYEGGSSFD